MHSLRTLSVGINQELLTNFSGLLHRPDDLIEDALFQELIKMALNFYLMLLLPFVVLSNVTKDNQLTVLVIKINVNALQQVKSVLLKDTEPSAVSTLSLLLLRVTMLDPLIKLVDFIILIRV